ncbi:hypothetical protein T12_12946 [Trichinella patagoniensis]|uniref:Uncharacterized protein n=1 Tax=Trichinella patagoniensis TaxID=990121 RepID=A0A0V1A8T4_9BILA|nr:hypothetical protein T12_12946 [Trichinella patagoniensis]
MFEQGAFPPVGAPNARGVSIKQQPHFKLSTVSNTSTPEKYPRTAASLCTPSHLTTKGRNCGSRFLVPDTPCIWCSNRWKCSLFGKKILNLKKLLPNEQTAILLILQARYRQYQATKR